MRGAFAALLLGLGALYASNLCASDKPSRHWAFQPVRNPSLPAISDPSWVKTPIDALILARLDSAGLSTSPIADKRTLIRRATYDLTGLPPTREEVEAFLHDTSSDAYARVIDRLLSSPHYGEQWGRHWLDVARYSDTKGYVYAREERFWVHAWVYRDWVVRALNSDMPYDRFLLLQIAADQVAKDDLPSLAAMGFLTLNRRFLGVMHDIIDDRIDVVTRGTMGLTVACARCHDHKYDPIPTRDYYSLYGIFRNCAEQVLPITATPADKATAETFEKGLRDRQRKLQEKTTTLRTEAATRARARISEYLEAQLEMHKYPEEGFDQYLTEGDLIPATVRRWREYLARMAAQHDPVFAAWHAFARLSDAEFASKADRISHELLQASPKDINPLIAQAFAQPPKTMRAVARRYGELFHRIDQQKSAPLADPNAEALRRVMYGPDSPCEVPDESIVTTEMFFTTPGCEELWKLQGEVDRWLIRSPAAPAYATILVDRPITTNARVLRRGNPAQPTVDAPRQFLEVLGGPQRKPFHMGSGRLELAQAIIDPKNPLTARVIVNRVWQHHFGAGLVHTPSDFGARAEPPSHPELLDWLASGFMSERWSLKKLHRLIMLSAAYQQASTGPTSETLRAKAVKLDPENRLLWRMAARRLTFEELRDSLLAAAGELDAHLGGKPVDLFKSPFPHGRTLYGLVDREFFPNVLRSFDCANPDLHTPQRSETTVPQQALFFLNNQFLIECSRLLVKYTPVAEASRPEERIRRMFQQVYQRDPTEEQMRSAMDLVRSAVTDRMNDKTKQLDPWQQLAQVLLMANEFAFVD